MAKNGLIIALEKLGLSSVIVDSAVAAGSALFGGYTAYQGLNSNSYNANSVNGGNYIGNSTTIFPYDLINTSSGRDFYMLFNFYQYQRPSVYTTATSASVGSIILPLPSNLIDSQSLDYQEYRLTPGTGAALDAASRLASEGAQQGYITASQGGAAAYQAAQGGAVSGLSNMGNAIGAILGTKLGTTDVLQLGGLAVNPFTTVLFQAPSFKHHTFTWKFIPKNQKDADTLKFIINKFRYHSLPDLSMATGGTLLRYPDMVLPAISPTGYVYSFKHCMIEEVISNFAPGATPSFTREAYSPSAIQFTLRLIEIEFWLKQDLLSNDLNYSIPSDVNLNYSLNQVYAAPSVSGITNQTPPSGTAGIASNGTVSQ